MTGHRLTSIEAICLFAFAGNATITLRSAKTGARFTYKIREPEEVRGSVTHFVSVMTGPDNEDAFQYLGQFRGPDYERGKKSRIGADAPSARAFDYFAECLKRNTLPASLEVYHEGRCGACNRKLTVPESILTGLGPECSERLGVARVKCDDPSALERALT